MDGESGQVTGNQTTTGSTGAAPQQAATGSIASIMAGSSTTTAPTAGQTAEPVSGDVAGAGQGGSDPASGEVKLGPWADQLSKDFKGNPEIVKHLSKFNGDGFNGITKAYLELSQKLGSSVTLPGKDAKPEEVRAFYEKLGLPKSAEAYTFKQDTDGAKAFAKFAYENNIPDGMAAGLYKFLDGIAQDTLKTQAARVEALAQETEKSLQGKYKDQYPAQVEYLDRAMRAYGTPELTAVLKQSGLMFNPAIVETFMRIGEHMSEAGATRRSGRGNEPIKPLNEGGGWDYPNSGK